MSGQETRRWACLVATLIAASALPAGGAEVLDATSLAGRTLVCLAGALLVFASGLGHGGTLGWWPTRLAEYAVISKVAGS